MYTFQFLCSKLSDDFQSLKSWSLNLKITSHSNDTFFITLQLKILASTAHCSHMSPFRARQHFHTLPILHLLFLPATTATIPSLPAHPITAPGPFSPCNICLSPEMKRKCLPVGLQVAHHEGGQRLIPVISLC